MYTLTLYKNCIINADYNEVFRDTTLLEEYLSSLINWTTEIKPINYDINGTIKLNIISFSPTEIMNLFTFNYMKVISNDTNPNLKLYLIITNVYTTDRIINIEYVLDVWHTYNTDWDIRYGLMSNCLHYEKYSEIEECDYPLDYMTASNLQLVNHNNPAVGERRHIYVLLQTYDLSNGDNIKDRISIGGFLLDGHEEYVSVDDINETLNALNNQTIYQNFEFPDVYHPDDSTKGVYSYFDIVKIYVIPASYCDTTITKSNEYWIHEFIGATESPNHRRRFAIRHCTFFNNNKPEMVYSVHLQPNKYIRSYGTFNSQIPYKYNGNIQTINIECICNSYDFKLYMNSCDGYIDITEDFRYDLNYNIKSKELLTNQEIERKMQTTKGIVGIVNNVANIASSVMGLNLGYHTMQGSGTSQIAWARGQQQIANSGSNIVGSVGNIVIEAQNIKYTNMEKYKNSYVCNNEKTVTTTSVYALCTMEIIYPINDIEVMNTINIIGFSVNAIINHIKTVQEFNPIPEIRYDIIKYSNVSIRGCNNIINTSIANILTNGTKIWYALPV